MQRISPIHIAVIAIIAVGALLRVYGMSWDEGLYLHPDERFIAIVSSERVDLPAADNLSLMFNPAHSPMNPRRDGPDGKPLSFAYGTLPIYVQSAVSWAVNIIAETDYQGYRHVYEVGRPLTVVMDMLTMVFVFLLARRLFGPAAAIVAMALYAFSVLAIQLSHFFTVDVWLTCFVTASLYFAVRYVDDPSLGRALAMGIPVGCAFATKASVPALLLPLLIAAGWNVWRSDDRGRSVLHVVYAGALAVAVFTLFEPYAIVRARPFIEDISLQSKIVRGHNDVPFTRQFVGLTPGLYELKNLARYTIGPAFTFVSLIGTLYAARSAWRTRSVALLIPLAWVVAYVPTILLTEAKFLRYALPLIPVFAVLSAGFLTVGLARYSRLASRVAIATVVGTTAIWAFGFASIYASEHPRIAASKWMYANIPAGSAVSVESWDDALPLPYASAPPMSYQQVTFDIYGDEPPEEKAETLAESLQSVDYVILSSNRLIGSVDNLPWRYAVQNEYYRRLLEGQLGFRLVYDAQLRPSMFGYRYDDSGSDESFTVYDHPRVMIFEKVESLSTAQVRDRLLWGIEQPWIPQRYPLEETLRLDVPVAEIESTRDANWNGPGIDNGIAAIVFWLLAVEALGLAVLPIAAVALRRTPDRGAFSTRLLGLLVVGWIMWIAASIGLWESRALYYGIVLALTGIIAWGWWWKSTSKRALLPTPRMYATGAAIWLGVFSMFIALRAAYPDFWQTWFGGEKPFELAYLRAVAQSTSFPPYDPWFADGTINYYYYGWHLATTITKLSGVGVDHGFQLALATFAGLLALQAATLGAMLMRRGRARLPLTPVVVAGGVVVFSTLFAGNLDAVYQVAGERALLADTFDFWRSTRVISYTINEFPYFSYLWADVHPHVINFPILLLLLTLLVHVMLAGGLHFTRSVLLPAGLIALALGTVGVTNSWDLPLAIGLTVVAFGYLGLQRSVRAGMAGASVGAIVTVASFALFSPFYLGFYSVVEGVQRSSAGSRLGEFLAVWGIFFAIIVLATLSEAVTRVRHSAGLRDGLALGVVTLLTGTIAQAVDTLRGGVRTEYRDIVIALVLSALVIGVSAAATIPSRFAWWGIGAVGALSALSGAVVTFRPASTVALAIVATAAMHAYRVRRQPSRFVPWAMIGVAAVILAATEVINVADDLQRSSWERMNTIFKFYLQAWLLLAVGSGLVLTRLLISSRLAVSRPRWTSAAPLGLVAVTGERTSAHRATSGGRRLKARRAIAGVAAMVLLLGVAYPIAGTPVRLNQDMPSSPTGFTLDGYAWMDGGSIHNHTGEVIDFTGDLAAIEWLSVHVAGTPVILEAAIGPYRGNGSRISSATGLPAVMGWDRHQRQQRYEAGISKRMADVRSVYNETNTALKMETLRRYRVEYVIVGDVERYWNTDVDETFYASQEGLAAFEAMVGDGLSVVFEAGSTRIYRVEDFPRVAPAPDAVHRL